MICILTLTSCAISENLSDGYDRGDITKGLVQDFRIYCSTPVSYVRQLGRGVVFATTGITLPDVCP